MAGIVYKIFKELSLKDIPIAVKPRFFQLSRQSFKLLHIIGLVFHKRFIILNKSLNKNIIIGVFGLLKTPVDKKPLDPCMTLSAGVAGQIHSLGEIVDTTKAGTKHFKLMFRKLCCLVEKDTVIFRTLKIIKIAVFGTISE